MLNAFCHFDSCLLKPIKYCTDWQDVNRSHVHLSPYFRAMITKVVGTITDSLPLFTVSLQIRSSAVINIFGTFFLGIFKFRGVVCTSAICISIYVVKRKNKIWYMFVYYSDFKSNITVPNCWFVINTVIACYSRKAIDAATFVSTFAISSTISSIFTRVWKTWI